MRGVPHPYAYTVLEHSEVVVQSSRILDSTPMHTSRSGILRRYTFRCVPARDTRVRHVVSALPDKGSPTGLIAISHYVAR